MRALSPFLLLAVGCWAALAWCFVSFRMLIGTDHIHMPTRHLAAWLLGVGLIFLVAVFWLDRRMTADLD